MRFKLVAYHESWDEVRTYTFDTREEAEDTIKSMKAAARMLGEENVPKMEIWLTGDPLGAETIRVG